MVDPTEYASYQSLPCVLWKPDADPTRYGRTRFNGASTYHHRAAFERASGAAIPEGFVVGHTCDVPACVQSNGSGTYVIRSIVRPRYGHLWLGTHADNMADRDAKGRDAWHDPQYHKRGESVGTSIFTTDDVLEARRLRREGFTIAAIARRLGGKLSGVRALVRGDTWGHVPGAIVEPSPLSRPCRWERGPKLTRTLAETIRSRCANGERQVDVAKAYGVDPSTVSNIVTGRLWKDVP